jgi:hypothetical protein
MSFRFGESQDWVGWFRLRYTSTLFYPSGSHARGLLSTAEEFFYSKFFVQLPQLGRKATKVMQANYILAGYLNNATDPVRPVVALHVSDSMSPKDLNGMLSDMHSKGTAYSCAVKAVDLRLLLGEEELATLVGQMEGARSLGDEALQRFMRFADGLLTAGAMMALQTPDIETILPQSR